MKGFDLIVDIQTILGEIVRDFQQLIGNHPAHASDGCD
jgi:hypothetical protein